MARIDETVAKPKNDAYTGMLAISFLALTVACVLLYLEYDSYGTTTPPSSPTIDVPGIKPTSAIAPRIEPAKPVEAPKETPKDGEVPKDGEAPKDAPAAPKDAPAAPKDEMPKDAPAPKGAPAAPKDAMPKDAPKDAGDKTSSIVPERPIRLPELSPIARPVAASAIVPVGVEIAPVGELPPLTIVLPDLRGTNAELPPLDIKPIVLPK